MLIDPAILLTANPTKIVAADAFWVIVGLAIASALVDWINKRRQKAEERAETGTPPPARRTPPVQPTPQPGRKLSRWEEELQELLKNLPTEQPTAPPAPPPLPPPVIIQLPRPQPPPAREPVVTHPPLVSTPRTVVFEAEDEGATILTGPQVTLARSQAAMERAGQLHREVARQLKRVDEMTELHRVGVAHGRRRGVPPHVAAAVALFRQPQTARQAMIAALILGQPKALTGD